MSVNTHELARLRAANPVPVEPESLTPVAAAALARILQEPVDEAIGSRADGPRAEWPSRARGAGRRILRRSPRRLIVVAAALVTAGGAAFAATDPLGWWSTNPTYAKYASNPAVHVRTPTEREIACARSAGVLRCSPAHFQLPSGTEIVNGHRSTEQVYTFIDAIPAPVRGFSRHVLLAYISARRAAGALTAVQAARFRADIAAVPDSFFTEIEVGSRYGTYGVGGESRNGLALVPPPGIPSVLVCEPGGGGLSCQDLNGDQHVPIGAGVYGAMTARSWRYERVPPENWNLPPGFSFSKAEYRVLVDMIRYATVTQTSGPVTGRATPAPPPEAPRG